MSRVGRVCENILFCVLQCMNAVSNGLKKMKKTLPSMFFYPHVSLSSSYVVCFSLFCLCALFGEKCQINRNVTSRIGGLLLYLLIEVPSCLSVWRLLLTSDVFFESESAFFSSECYRQQRSVRVKLNVGLYTEFLLPPAITRLVIHFIINPASFFQRIHSAHESFPLQHFIFV